MTNFFYFIALLSIFNVAIGCQDTCHIVDHLLTLPAPEDVYQKEIESEKEESTAVIIPISVFLIDSPKEISGNITVPSLLETPKPFVSEVFEEFKDEVSDDIKSMKITGFVAQCILFLFLFTIVTMDVDCFDEDENGEIVIHKLHKAREIQTCPLPSRQNIRIYRRFVESDC